ncbi:MAG TPA: hypothetical protein VFM37_03640 [Pseudonocardiaceae bacterium]|nr:hypothetical protein [Pseudonocardiaceae bacterium]
MSTLNPPPPRPTTYEFHRPITEAVVRRSPATARWSVRLWLAAGAVVTVTAGLALLGTDQLSTALLADAARQFPDEPQETRDRVVAAALLILIGSGLLIALLQVAFALAMGTRRRGARLVLGPLWLLGALHCAAVFGALPSPLLLGLPIATVLATAAVVTMFLPATNAWLAPRSGRHRLGGKS